MTLTTVAQGAPYNYQLRADNNGIYIPDPLALTIAGQMFASTTGLLTTAGNIITGHSIFNTGTNTKTVIIFSISITTAAAAMHRLFNVTTDPALTTVDTSINANLKSTITSVANLTFQNTAVTVPGGGAFLTTAAATNTLTEIMQPNKFIVCPPGSGILVAINAATVQWTSNIVWAEV